MRILSIDPSPTLQTYAILENQRVVKVGVVPLDGVARLAELAAGCDVVGVEDVEWIYNGGKVFNQNNLYSTAKAVGRIQQVFAGDLRLVMISRIRHVLMRLFGTTRPTVSTLAKLGIRHESLDLEKDKAVELWLKKNLFGFDRLELEIEQVRKIIGKKIIDDCSDFYSAVAVGLVAAHREWIEERNTETEAGREERKEKKRIARELTKAAGGVVTGAKRGRPRKQKPPLGGE